jgi:hypothetical protein
VCIYNRPPEEGEHANGEVVDP